jgi:hypothetical protein
MIVPNTAAAIAAAARTSMRRRDHGADVTITGLESRSLDRHRLLFELSNQRAHVVIALRRYTGQCLVERSAQPVHI